MKLLNENSHQVFETRRVRYARPRADELEFYSRSTTLPVKRRHQLMLRFYSCLVHALSVDEHKHRQECATLNL